MPNPYGPPGEKGYSQSGYSAPGSTGIPPSAPAHPGPVPGYPGQPAPVPGYQQPGLGYPPQAGYPTQGYQGQGYPYQTQGPPSQVQGYPTQAPAQGYPPQGVGQPPQGQGYPTQAPAQGYPPQGVGQPPPGQGYPAHGMHGQVYQAPAQGYSAQAPGYPAQGGYPGMAGAGGQVYQQAGVPPSVGGMGAPPPQGQPNPMAGPQGNPGGGYPLPPQQYAPVPPAGAAQSNPPGAGSFPVAQGQPGPQSQGVIKLEDHVLMTLDLEFDTGEPPDSPDNASRQRVVNDIIKSKKPCIICTQDCPENILNDANIQKGYVQVLKNAEKPGKFIYNMAQVMVVLQPGSKSAEDIMRDELGEEGNGLFAEHFRSTQPGKCDFQLVVVNWNGQWNGDQRRESDRKKAEKLELLFEAIATLKKTERFKTVPVVVGGTFTLKRDKWEDHPDVSYWNSATQLKGRGKKHVDMFVTSKDIELLNVQLMNLRGEDRELVSHDIVFGRIGPILSPLPFHESHGESITLDLHNEIATRETKKCDRAYVFTQRPLQLGETITAQILSYDDRRKGNVIFGLTSIDPKEWQTTELPSADEITEEDNEEWMVHDGTDAAMELDELTVHLGPNGCVRMELHTEDDEAEEMSKLMVDPMQKWWAFFNVIGKTVELRSIGSHIVDEETENKIEKEDLAEEEEEWEDVDGEEEEDDYYSEEEEEEPPRRGRKR